MANNNNNNEHISKVLITNSIGLCSHYKCYRFSARLVLHDSMFSNTCLPLLSPDIFKKKNFSKLRCILSFMCLCKIWNLLPRVLYCTHCSKVSNYLFLHLSKRNQKILLLSGARICRRENRILSR